MASINLGRIGMVLKGEWNNAFSYQRLDVVTKDGTSYVALTDNTNSDPTTLIDWQVMAEKGYQPAHEWDGTSIRFQNPDETWGEWVDVGIQQPIVDFSELPGNKRLIAGDNNAGFLGFVTGAELISGSGIASAIGLSAGTLINSDTPWIKYIWKGKICFYPLKPIRHSVAWDAIYNAGAVYGTGDEGLFPPMSRGGQLISIDATDNSINTTTQNFLGDKTAGMDHADTVGAVGDTLVLKGWTNAGNNGEVVIESITNTKIVVSGKTLVTEAGARNKRFYKKTNAVTQNAAVTINGVVGKVRLMKGASQDQLSSYADADRDSIGVNNEWNWIILQLHEQAKLKNWAYPAYVDSTLGDFGVYLTDQDLVTHYTFGSGSYRWCQETSDTTAWRRVYRGGFGASSLFPNPSWLVSSFLAFLPVLEFPQTSTL